MRSLCVFQRQRSIAVHISESYLRKSIKESTKSHVWKNNFNNKRNEVGLGELRKRKGGGQGAGGKRSSNSGESALIVPV